MEYADYVNRDECPELNIDDVPKDVLSSALASLQWRECPYCGERQWMNYVSGRNTTHECQSCEETIKTIG